MTAATDYGHMMSKSASPDRYSFKKYEEVSFFIEMVKRFFEKFPSNNFCQKISVKKFDEINFHFL